MHTNKIVLPPCIHVSFGIFPYHFQCLSVFIHSESLSLSVENKKVDQQELDNAALTKQMSQLSLRLENAYTEIKNLRDRLDVMDPGILYNKKQDSVSDMFG